jgi:integrase
VNWCVERGLLAARPFKTRPIKVQKKVLPTLWPEDVAAFLAAVKGLGAGRDMHTAILLMLSLGLRENEALGATWEGFDGRLGVYAPPKTKNREVREIALPPGLLEHLLSVYGEERTGLVMEGAAGGHRGGFTAKTVARAGLALGIVGLHPHSLRATFATAHWEAGTPLGQIMAMLGHAQPQTTMIYVRQRPRDAAAAQAKVAAAMGNVFGA